MVTVYPFLLLYCNVDYIVAANIVVMVWLDIEVVMEYETRCY